MKTYNKARINYNRWCPPISFLDIPHQIELNISLSFQVIK